jgi:hypothetical protein
MLPPISDPLDSRKSPRIVRTGRNVGAAAYRDLIEILRRLSPKEDWEL